MIRKKLPQNYIVDQGVQLLDFEDASNWFGGTVAVDPDHRVTGTNSLKFTTSVGGNSTSDTPVIWSLDQNGCFQLSIYVPDNQFNISSIDIYLTSRNDFAKYFTTTIYDQLFQGWNQITFGKHEFTNIGDDSWASIVKMRIRLNAKAGVVAVASFDDFRYKVDSLPRVIIGFDDGHASAYTEGIQYMNSKGLRGTMYVVKNLVDVAGYMTKAQLDDTYTNGWALGNHTRDHLDLSTLTAAQMEEQLKSCTEWLNAQGYTRASNHVAYPFGGYNDTTLQIMSKLGLKTGRTVLGGYHLTTPTLNSFQLQTLCVLPSHTLDALKWRVEQALLNGMSINILFHKLVTTPSTDLEWGISDFKALIDYIKERKVPVVTIDEWYNGLTNPRYRSI